MKLRFPALAVAGLAMLLLAPAAWAEHDLDWEGWIVELEGAILAPGGTDTALITTGFSALASQGTASAVWADWDNSISYELAAGYSWGRKGSLKVSYWSYDDDINEKGSNYQFYIYNFFTIGPIMNLGYTYIDPISWDFDLNMKASTIDIEYSRTKRVGNPLVLTFGLGFRKATFEETVKGQYVDDQSAVAGPIVNLPAQRTVESDGIGFTGSVGADFDFNEWLALRGNMRVGFLTTDLNASHSLDAADYPNPGGVFVQEVEQNDEISTTLDFETSITFHTGPYFDVDVGWTATQWWGMADVPLSGSETTFTTHVDLPDTKRDRLGWSGWFVRARLHL